MTIHVTSSLSTRGKTIEALVSSSKDAALAQRTAMRSARTKARSLAAKNFAGRFGVPLKVFRRRIQAFAVRAPRDGVATARLWLGKQTPPGGADHNKVRKVLLGRVPGSRATRRGDVVTGRGEDIIFHRLPFLNTAATLIESVRTAMTETYLPKLRSDYRRRRNKRRFR